MARKAKKPRRALINPPKKRPPTRVPPLKPEEEPLKKLDDLKLMRELLFQEIFSNLSVLAMLDRFNQLLIIK